jgi:hypothetical protein
MGKLGFFSSKYTLTISKYQVLLLALWGCVIPVVLGQYYKAYSVYISNLYIPTHYMLLTLPHDFRHTTLKLPYI